MSSFRAHANGSLLAAKFACDHVICAVQNAPRVSETRQTQSYAQPLRHGSWRTSCTSFFNKLAKGHLMLDKDHVSRKEGIAAVLSLMVPGAGQIYNGDFLRGAFWLLVTPGFWLGTGGMLGWACHFTSAYTAHRRGTRGVRAIVTT